MQVKLRKIYPNSQLFSKAHKDDACFDVYAHFGENATKESKVVFGPNEKISIGTGIKMSIPVGYEGVIRPRSGLSLKTGLKISNSPGTIDAGYRDEVKIILENSGVIHHTVRQGDRIAQIGFRIVPDVEIIEVFDEVDLGASDRGNAGFGSTGK